MKPRDRHVRERGQAVVLVVGLIALLVAGALLLGALAQGVTAKGRHQRAADLAAICAAQSMREAYPRLFETATAGPGAPNPRALGRAGYLALARDAAEECARRNGVELRGGDVEFPDERSFAPVRVRVTVRGEEAVRVAARAPRRRVPVRASATAELVPGATAPAVPGEPSGGEYGGPFAHRQGKPMRPDVALAFDRMAAAARREAGISLIINSAFRSNAEQARLFAANPDPRMVAPPGQSLHRLGTELDLGPEGAYGWLASNAERFGFVKRYSWEPWHYGYTHNAGTASVGFGRRGTPDGSRSAIPSFVPARYAPAIGRAAQRWNVSAGLLSAQLYAESNFNPFAVSSAGARGIAQFMPGTARAYGLSNPEDAEASIDAQAHLMRDLLQQFASVPLALAAYNAGSGAVSACGCIPYAETRAYVSKILGLLGGTGEVSAPAFTVRLVR